MAACKTALPVSLVLSTQKLRAVLNGLFVISSFCLLLNTFLFFLFACHFLFLVFFPSSNFCLNLFLFSVFCSFFISFFLFSTFSVLMFLFFCSLFCARIKTKELFAQSLFASDRIFESPTLCVCAFFECTKKF